MMKEMTMDEKRMMLLEAVFQGAAKLVEERVADSSAFRSMGCRFVDPETQIRGTIHVEPSTLEQDKYCCIRVGCLTPGTDRLHSYYIFRGDKQQVLDWLADPANMEQSMVHYETLRARCLED